MGRKQQRVPGTEDPSLDELDNLADELAEVHSDHMDARNRENELRSLMVDKMEKHDRTLYERNGMRFEITEGKRKLKIKTLGDDEG